MNQELPYVQAGFRKGRGNRDQIANIRWVIEKARKLNVYFFIDYARAFDCVDHNKLWKILRDGNIRPPYMSPEKPVCRARNKLESDMEHLTDLKLRNECIGILYCHPLI